MLCSTYDAVVLLVLTLAGRIVSVAWSTHISYGSVVACSRAHVTLPLSAAIESNDWISSEKAACHLQALAWARL